MRNLRKVPLPTQITQYRVLGTMVKRYIWYASFNFSSFSELSLALYYYYTIYL